MHRKDLPSIVRKPNFLLQVHCLTDLVINCTPTLPLQPIAVCKLVNTFPTLISIAQADTQSLMMCLDKKDADGVKRFWEIECVV